MNFVESYNPIDLFILGTLLICLVLGFWKGFIRSLSALVGLVLGVAAALKYHAVVGSYLGKISSLDPLISTILSMILIFIGVQVVFVLIRRLLDALIDLTRLGWLDRVLGGAMGICAGGVLVAASVQAVLVAVPELPVVKSSRLVKPVDGLTARGLSYAPKEVRDQVQSLIAKYKGQEVSLPAGQRQEVQPKKSPAAPQAPGK
jgi:membrane protein required for colicin V production